MQCTCKQINEQGYIYVLIAVAACNLKIFSRIIYTFISFSCSFRSEDCAKYLNKLFLSRAD